MHLPGGKAKPLIILPRPPKKDDNDEDSKDDGPEIGPRGPGRTFFWKQGRGPRSIGYWQREKEEKTMTARRRPADYGKVITSADSNATTSRSRRGNRSKEALDRFFLKRSMRVPSIPYTAVRSMKSVSPSAAGSGNDPLPDVLHFEMDDWIRLVVFFRFQLVDPLFGVRLRDPQSMCDGAHFVAGGRRRRSRFAQSRQRRLRSEEAQRSTRQGFRWPKADCSSDQPPKWLFEHMTCAAPSDPDTTAFTQPDPLMSMVECSSEQPPQRPSHPIISTAPSALGATACSVAAVHRSVESHEDRSGGVLTPGQEARAAANLREAMRRRAAAAARDAMTVTQLMRIREHRSAALRRRSQVARSAPSDETTAVLRLQRVHAHPRDSRIEFFEDGHYYILDRQTRFPLSVSGVWSQYFPRFDAMGTVNQYFDVWATDRRSKYHACIVNGRADGDSDLAIKQRIVDGWSLAGRQASEEGTRMHRHIELYLNARCSVDDTTELQQFEQWLREEAAVRGWRPYRTEWSVFSDLHMVAGQIDSIWVDSDGRYHMVDWKRCKHTLSAEEGSHWGRFGTTPLEFLVDNAFNHYVIQQSLGLTFN